MSKELNYSFDGKNHHFKVSLSDEYYQYLSDHWFLDEENDYGIAKQVEELLKDYALDCHEGKILKIRRMRSVA